MGVTKTMGRVKTKGTLIENAANYSESVNEDLKDTLKQAEALLDKVSDMKWKGNARDAFVSYLDIVSQYHKDIESKAKDQHKAFKNLSEKIDGYSSDDSVVEVKRI